MCCVPLSRFVGPNVPVGIMMERCHHLVVCMLGVLKAGGFYVPLDPDYPADRLEFMLKVGSSRLEAMLKR